MATETIIGLAAVVVLVAAVVGGAIYLMTHKSTSTNTHKPASGGGSTPVEDHGRPGREAHPVEAVR